jgi:hypothetical protein
MRKRHQKCMKKEKRAYEDVMRKWPSISQGKVSVVTKPADALILDFWLPELSANKCLWLKHFVILL